MTSIIIYSLLLAVIVCGILFWGKYQDELNRHARNHRAALKRVHRE